MILKLLKPKKSKFIELSSFTDIIIFRISKVLLYLGNCTEAIKMLN